MRIYADSSFIVRLVTNEVGSPAAIAEYRRLGSPELLFLPLHHLEVRNAILQRAFHQRHSAGSETRRHFARERDAALSRIERFLSQRALLEVSLDMDAAITRAVQLSTVHGEQLGTRAIDLLHVASALLLQSECFLTSDVRQAQLAKVEGLRLVAATAN